MFILERGGVDSFAFKLFLQTKEKREKKIFSCVNILCPWVLFHKRVDKGIFVYYNWSF